MLNIKYIRDNPEEVEAKLKTKEPEISLSLIVELDSTIRALKSEGEKLKMERNSYSKMIGELKRQGQNAQKALDAVASISARAHAIDQELAPLEQQLHDELAKLPNIPMDDVKVSANPADNVVVREWGEKPTFSFEPKNHLELNATLGLFDFERGAKISGSGWPVYRNLGARLEWALINHMLQYHFDNGYCYWMPPALVREEALFGSGQLPKFENQQFKISDDDYALWLIPTAEVPLNGLHAQEIFEAGELPKKYVAYTPCFRREAGAAGKQERGLIRMHQFNKVEMFCFSTPEESSAIFDEMVGHAEALLQSLGLHYRTMLLVTGDTSFSSTRTIDIEVWLPGQQRYYEVSSISNCTDFQARRSMTRYRDGDGKPHYVHTLNGSGLATSRLMVALLESNQSRDGHVAIPEVLQPAMGGRCILDGS